MAVVQHVADDQAHRVAAVEQPGDERRDVVDVPIVGGAPVLRPTAFTVILHQPEAHDATGRGGRLGADLGAWKAEDEIGIHGIARHRDAERGEQVLRKAIPVRTVIGQRERRLHEPPTQSMLEATCADADEDELAPS